MNGSPESEIDGKSRPPGFENWSWMEKENFLNGNGLKTPDYSQVGPAPEEASVEEPPKEELLNEELPEIDEFQHISYPSLPQEKIESTEKINAGDVIERDGKEEVIEDSDLTVSEKTPEAEREPEPEPGPETRNGEMPKIGNLVNFGDYAPPEKKTPNEFFEKPRLTAINPSENVDQDISEDVAPALPPNELVKAKEENLTEWEKFERLRIAKAGIENDFRKGKVSQGYLDEVNLNYGNQRERVAQEIRDRLRGEMGEGPFTPEQEYELRLKINDAEIGLLKKENDEYLRAVKKDRGETWKDKAMGGLKNALGSKLFQVYMRQNKWVRLGVTTTIATGVGYGLGAVAAAGAVGYAGARLVRGAASFGAAAGVNKLIQEKTALSIDWINEQEKREIERLKNSDFTLQKKSEYLDQIIEKYRKEKRKAVLVKTAMTVGAGAGVGMLAGLSEHLIGGVGGSSAADQVNRPKTGAKVNFEQKPEAETDVHRGEQIEKSEQAEQLKESEKSESTDQAEQQKGPEKTEVEVKESEKEVAETVKNTEKLFDDPKILVHEVKAGDSSWKVLKNILNNNEQFKGMTEAQKTYVLSAMTGKIMQNPEVYGVGKNGMLEVGKQMDSTKLFENTEEVKSIFNKAVQTIKEGSSKEELILENNAKIATWVNEHPGEALNESKVSEILNTKPKVENISEDTPSVESAIMPVPEKDPVASMIDAVRKSDSELETAKSPLPETLEKPKTDLSEGVKENPELSDEEKIHQDINDAKQRLASLEGGAATSLAGVAGIAGVASVGGLDDYKRKRDERQTLIDIEEAKGVPKDKILEKLDRNPGLKRSLRSDLEAVKKESEFSEAVEKALANDVNRFFTEGLIFKTEGIKSQKWNFIRRLSFAKLVKYYTGDSNDSGLSQEAVEELKKSERYHKFVDYVSWLKDQIDGTVILFEENASIESVLRKVGKQLLENSKTKLRPAA